MSDEGFISRWSRKKTAARAAPEKADDTPPQVPPTPAEAPPVEAAKPLPPVESLTPESDFTPFMKADVNPVLRRQAVKMLFQDPRFNVMDGLDTYIADYSLADPLPAGWLEKMTQTARLGLYREPEPEAEAAQAQPASDQGAIEEADPPPDTVDEGSQPAPMAQSPHREGAEEEPSGVDFPQNKASMPRTPND